jgi:small subunit ribosomal protein S1
MSPTEDPTPQGESTVPDGSGGVITRTAPSTSGATYAGGVIVENDVGDSEEAMLAAIEATIKPFDEGDIVTGTVVKIDKDEVLLDIGYKSEGVIPSRELSIRNDVNPGDVVTVGDDIEALVLQKEDADGRLILSKKRAQYERAWGKIEDIKQQDGTVSGPVIEVVKGGLILDIGLRGFLPASLVEMRRVRDLIPYIGKDLECKIIELDKNRNNVVLSRRKFLEESQAEQRHDFLQSLQKGEVRKGSVSSIVNFGAFVDLGGVDGLVHVSELSWKHVDHPSEVVEVGQEVAVEVLDVDLERERVSLSLKATQEDPWRQFARQHEVGDFLEGRVTKIVPFGAFVEIDDVIEGLVHISEIAEHHVEKPEDEVKVHDRVKVKIIDIDLDRRRISLSRKQAIREEGAPPREEGVAPEIELEREGEAETRAESAAEDAGVGTEDTIRRPQSEEEIASAAEAAPEITLDPSAPEAAPTSQDAAEQAVFEEADEAEHIAHMSKTAPAEGAEDTTAADPDRSSTGARLAQEEPEEGAPEPGEAVDEIVAEEEPAATAEGEAVEEEDTDKLEPEDSTGEQSIEAIVEDLKRERGQK